MDLGGVNTDAISISGTNSNIKNNLSQPGVRDSTFINVNDASLFSIGDYIQLSFNDSSIITSSWAYKTVGQIAKVKNIIANKIVLESPLRLDYLLSKSPVVSKINVVEGVGIECLKIVRVDSIGTTRSNINFNRAAQCWV